MPQSMETSFESMWATLRGRLLVGERIRNWGIDRGYTGALSGSRMLNGRRSQFLPWRSPSRVVSAKANSKRYFNTGLLIA